MVGTRSRRSTSGGKYSLPQKYFDLSAQPKAAAADPGPDFVSFGNNFSETSTRNNLKPTNPFAGGSVDATKTDPFPNGPVSYTTIVPPTKTGGRRSKTKTARRSVGPSRRVRRSTRR